jgi:putative phosphoribosyl transferase
METTAERTSGGRTVRIAAGSAVLEGDLGIPGRAEGIVLFAHGSGSSRLSPRNRFVARLLEERGFATLLIDLLTPEEEEIDRWTRHLRFDIELLAGRLVSVTDWLLLHPDTRLLKIAYFGASTGAAAALIAATERPDAVHAIVSRGGRPDLAAGHLARVTAPTLLIVGEDDIPGIRPNRQALEQLQAGGRLEVVPGAGHLFEEPGTLEEVARLAGQWFEHHLTSSLEG